MPRIHDDVLQFAWQALEKFLTSQRIACLIQVQHAEQIEPQVCLFVAVAHDEGCAVQQQTHVVEHTTQIALQCRHQRERAVFDVVIQQQTVATRIGCTARRVVTQAVAPPLKVVSLGVHIVVATERAVGRIDVVFLCLVIRPRVVVVGRRFTATL